MKRRVSKRINRKYKRTKRKYLKTKKKIKGGQGGYGAVPSAPPAEEVFADAFAQRQRSAGARGLKTMEEIEDKSKTISQRVVNYLQNFDLKHLTDMKSRDKIDYLFMYNLFMILNRVDSSEADIAYITRLKSKAQSIERYYTYCRNNFYQFNQFSKSIFSTIIEPMYNQYYEILSRLHE